MKRLTFFFLLLTLNVAAMCQAQTVLTISSETDSFGITNTFNNISLFEFNIELTDDIVAGMSYTNPSINFIDYAIDGSLPQGSPSGFPAFALTRSYSGTDFYAQSTEQGFESGLDFTIDASADLSDGLQLSELVGTGSDTIFFFNAREFNQDPGRYHPPQLELFADGTGTLQNANNESTFPNSSNGQIVDVDFGEEYISTLSFDPAAITIANVPEPSSMAILSSLAMIGLARRQRV